MTAFPLTNYDALALAIAEFEAALPGWWWSVGACSESRDASCGPDIDGPDADLLRLEDRSFDEGFHCDDHRDGSTVTGSLRVVMTEALMAKAKIGR